MSQSLELNIKTTSDVPQAAEKARAAIDSLEKRASASKGSQVSTTAEQAATKSSTVIGSQFDKIGKSFGNTISSVFLSFAGPLALITGIISFIGNSIAEARQLAADGLNRIAEGKTKFATDEEAKMAAFFKAKDASKKEMTEVKAGREEMTRRFLTETAEGKAISGGGDRLDPTYMSGLISNKEIQKKALEAFLSSEEGKKFAPMFEAEKATKENSFKAPEGFSNVVGVGANPVLQAMDEALSESKKQTSLLEDIASGGKRGFYDDFTKQDIGQKTNAASMANL